MPLFGKSSPAFFEESFLKHLKDEEETGKSVVVALESIKTELHRIDSKIQEYNSAHDLKISECKSQQELELMKQRKEILELMFDRMLEKKELKPVNSELVKINKTIDGKVSKSEVRIAYTVFLSIAGLIKWLYG